MSRLANLNSLRLGMFSSWRSSFVENNIPEYRQLFFRDFEIHQYLQGLFKKLGIVPNESKVRQSSTTIFLYSDLYLYKFHLVRYLSNIVSYQFFSYDFFFRFFPQLNGFRQSIFIEMYQLNKLSIFLGLFRHQGRYLSLDKELLFLSAHYSTCSDRQKQFARPGNFFSLIINYWGFERGQNSNMLFRKPYNQVFFGFGGKKNKSPTNSSSLVFFFIYFKNVYFFFSHLLSFNSKGFSNHLRFFLNFFFKWFIFFSKKFNLLKEYCQFYFRLPIVVALNSSLKLLSSDHKSFKTSSELVLSSINNFFFYYFCNNLTLSIEKTISEFSGLTCVFVPKLFFARSFPSLNSSELLANYLTLALEQGNSLFRTLKGVRQIQVKDKSKAGRNFGPDFIRSFFSNLIRRKRKFVRDFFKTSAVLNSFKLRQVVHIFMLTLKKDFFNVFSSVNEILASELQKKKYPLAGIRIECSGALKKGRQAQVVAYHNVVKDHKLFGRMPQQSIAADVDFFQSFARTPSGVVGIKVWIFFYTKVFDKSRRLVAIV